MKDIPTTYQLQVTPMHEIALRRSGITPPLLIISRLQFIT